MSVCKPRGSEKRWAGVSEINPHILPRAINEMRQRQIYRFGQLINDQRQKCRPKTHENVLYQEICFRVSHFALKELIKSEQHAREVTKERRNLSPCTWRYRAVYGIPCWHDVLQSIRANWHIHLLAVAMHWYLIKVSLPA